MRNALRIIGGLMSIATTACVGQPTGTGGAGTGAGTSAPTAAATAPAAASSVTVPLPAGDVAAGRQAFLDLKCTTCHAVPSALDFPKPIAASPGPPIDARLAGADVSYLMTAIMSPSHAMSRATSPAVKSHVEGVLSPMGDFSRVMTVRQLIDLHAFVRSVK